MEGSASLLRDRKHQGHPALQISSILYQNSGEQKQQWQLNKATSDATPCHTSKFFCFVFFNLGVEHHHNHLLLPPLLLFFKGFTSCRSGEACVSWEPQCGTGCGHPAKAAQSSWRENNGQSTLSSRVKTSENNWNAPAAFSHFISYICYTHRLTMTDADIKNSFRFL